MKIPLYLAMTAAEFAACRQYPAKCGWMACHFSPYCTGLSNIPASLPSHSLLIVNDITPIHGHDPQRIFDTLKDLISAFRCEGVLLDFQRANSDETARLVKKLLDLPIAVCVSEIYAEDLSCSVFLPPPPIRKELAEYLFPWQGREIWLEAALSRELVEVTKEGRRVSEGESDWKTGIADEKLYCHYSIEADEISAKFHLQRTPEDLRALLAAAADLGVAKAIGLYQELKDFPLFNSSNL